MVLRKDEDKIMNTSNIVIRLEQKEEYREVENLVRESFWNVYRPGCLEHYVLNQLRNDSAFVPELELMQAPSAFVIMDYRKAKMLPSFYARN